MVAIVRSPSVVFRFFALNQNSVSDFSWLSKNVVIVSRHKCATSFAVVDHFVPVSGHSAKRLGNRMEYRNVWALAVTVKATRRRKKRILKALPRPSDPFKIE